MEKLTVEEARFIRRWLYIETDTDRDIFLRAFGKKDNYGWVYILLISMIIIMTANFYGFEGWAEKFLR